MHDFCLFFVFRFSIVMTTFSTVAALGMMPLLLFLYSQGFDSLQNAVPYTGITVALVMTLVPCGFGIAINHFKPHYSPTVIKVSHSPSVWNLDCYRRAALW